MTFAPCITEDISVLQSMAQVLFLINTLNILSSFSIKQETQAVKPDWDMLSCILLINTIISVLLSPLILSYPIYVALSGSDCA